jgi:hypothetical protein
MEKQKRSMRKTTGIAVTALLVIAAFGIMPVAADTLSDHNHIYIPMSDDSIRYNEFNDYTYYVNFSEPTGGLNAVHISNNAYTVGQVTSSGPTSGTFYVTDFGGRGFQDDIVLLVSVYGTGGSPNITLNMSGNTWDYTATNGNAPESLDFSGYTKNVTLTSGDYLTDIEQTWKPGPYVDLPIFDGQEDYNLIFVDTLGGISNVSPYYNGSVKVEYDISGLSTSSEVVFNAYAWNYMTRKPNGAVAFNLPGIRWTNDVEGNQTNANVWKVTV